MTDRTDDDRLECWDPAHPVPPCEADGAPCPKDVGGDRRQTGLCGEAQADGVPCPDPTRLCELCGRAHR